MNVRFWDMSPPTICKSNCLQKIYNFANVIARAAAARGLRTCGAGRGARGRRRRMACRSTCRGRGRGGLNDENSESGNNIAQSLLAARLRRCNRLAYFAVTAEYRVAIFSASAIHSKMWSDPLRVASAIVRKHPEKN